MKRILIAMLAAVVVCGFSGCKADEKQTEIVSETTQTLKTTAPENIEKHEFETSYQITDWSSDDFRTIQCHGIDISIPCKLSDIDERIKVKVFEADENSVTDTDFVELYFNDEHIGTMCYEKDEYNTETDNLVLLSLESFSVKGLNETSTKEDVQKILGAGNHIDSEYAEAYYTGDMMIIFHYYNDHTSITITVYK